MFIFFCFFSDICSAQKIENFSIYTASSDIVLIRNSGEKEINYPIRGTPVCFKDSVILKGYGAHISIRDNNSSQVYKLEYSGTTPLKISVKYIYDFSKQSDCSNKYLSLIKKIVQDYGVKIDTNSLSDLFVYKGDGQLYDLSQDITLYTKEDINDQIEIVRIENEDTFHYCIVNNSPDVDYYLTFCAISPLDSLFYYSDIISPTGNGPRNDKIRLIPCRRKQEIELSYINFPLDYDFTSYFSAIPASEVNSDSLIVAFVNYTLTCRPNFKGDTIIVNKLSKINH